MENIVNKRHVTQMFSKICKAVSEAYGQFNCQLLDMKNFMIIISLLPLSQFWGRRNVFFLIILYYSISRHSILIKC